MSQEIVFEVFDAQKHSAERKIAFNEDMLVYWNQTAVFTVISANMGSYITCWLVLS